MHFNCSTCLQGKKMFKKSPGYKQSPFSMKYINSKGKGGLMILRARGRGIELSHSGNDESKAVAIGEMNLAE